uniref:Uncharacterized protein n=1 Tax=Rhizophagus irregularis (strain DAOM 181602 / DAOM 197198 / MUCL 43194) TaxID=747089 RepID=U9TFK1_RHIID
MLAVNKAQIKVSNFSAQDSLIREPQVKVVLRIFRLIRIFFTAVIVIDFRLRNTLLSMEFNDTVYTMRRHAVQKSGV